MPKPMSATNFNTRNDTYRKLMGGALSYRVPRFQRDYGWTEDEWYELWQDILDVMPEGGEPSHYMGHLVLESADDKHFNIIDGQQRLTTLSLLVLAAIRQLQKLQDESQDPDQTQKRIEGLRQSYIGYLDPVTLKTQSKLTLNRHTDGYYQKYLAPLADRLPTREVKPSERNLCNAFEWFGRQISVYVDGKIDPGKAIAELIGAMSDKLFFTVITVTDELNAYKVFQTLNARGVRLSTTDLLKSYLFLLLDREGVSDEELDILEKRWGRLVDRLGELQFPDFFRAHWIRRRTFVRKSGLFKAIQNSVEKREDVLGLLRQMDEDVDIYLLRKAGNNSIRGGVY